MLFLWTFIAEVPEPRKTGWEFPIFWNSLPLIGALLAGALVIYLVDRWRRRTALRRLDPSDQLASFRRAHERGEMSADEFEKVRALLAGQLRQDLQVPPRTSSAPLAPPVQAEPETRPAPHVRPPVEPPGS
jgi:hypothetical protein